MNTKINLDSPKVAFGDYLFNLTDKAAVPTENLVEFLGFIGFFPQMAFDITQSNPEMAMAQALVEAYENNCGFPCGSPICEVEKDKIGDFLYYSEEKETMCLDTHYGDPELPFIGHCRCDELTELFVFDYGIVAIKTPEKLTVYRFD